MSNVRLAAVGDLGGEVGQFLREEEAFGRRRILQRPINLRRFLGSTRGQLRLVTTGWSTLTKRPRAQVKVSDRELRDGSTIDTDAHQLIRIFKFLSNTAAAMAIAIEIKATKMLMATPPAISSSPLTTITACRNIVELRFIISFSTL